MTAPDLIVPLLGWRQWRVRDGILHSPHLGTRWDPGVLVARCEPYPQPGEIWDSAPAIVPNLMGETCRCGDVHEVLSFPTPAGCKPRAYPVSYARTYSLVEPIAPTADAVPYAQWHRAPDEACSCGWYGLHRPRAEWRETADTVVGAIGGWGTTQLTPEGFRCELTTVLGIVGDPELSARYGAHSADSIEALSGMIVEAAPAPESMYPRAS